MKNVLLKWTVRFLQRWIPRSEKRNRILIVSTTGLGDSLWATPAIESLRKSYPDAWIASLTSPIGMKVFENNPYLNRCFLYKFSHWNLLRKQQFDTVLIFHTSLRLVLPMCALLGASQIIGTAGINKGLDALLTTALPQTFQHEIVRRLKIIEALGAKTHTEQLSFFLKDRPIKFKTLTIALHPGAKDAFKRWPHFAKLGRILKERLACDIIITGTETDLKEKIAQEIPGARIDSQNHFSLFAQIDLLISNDTGPMHLACALNTPVIALYGATDPELCGPHKAEHAISLGTKPICSPCLKRKCRVPFCLLQIGVEEVAKKAEEICIKKRLAL